MVERWRIWMGGIVGLTCVALLAHRFARRDEPEPGAPSSEERGRSEPRAARPGDGARLSEVDALQDQVRTLRRQVAALAQMVGQSDGVQGEQSSQDAHRLTPEEIEKSQAQWRAHMAEVHAGFASERREVGWANETRAALHDELDNDPLLGPLVRSVECHSTTCRVELLDDAQPDFSKSVSQFCDRVAHMLPNLKADYKDNGDGTRTASYYLSIRAADGEG